MLCCASSRTPESTAIDKELRQQFREEQYTLKVLILGTSASGKSTLCKQMKILHCNGFTKEELDNYAQIIVLNIINALQELVHQAENFHIKILRKNRQIANFFTTCNPYTVKLDEEVVAKAIQLWLDRGVQEMWRRRNEINMPTNLEYMMDNIERFAQPDFVPTYEDILQARQRTTGAVDTKFTIGKYHWCITDVGGQKNERRKWIHFFDGVSSVIYCAALDEFDIVCPEDPSRSKMDESLEVFESMVNADIFVDKPFILFLNKKDLFKRKIKLIDLTEYFPDYEGGHRYKDAVEYIKNLYLSRTKKRPKTDIYVHVTCALDTENVKFVFDAVTDTIVSQCLQYAGLV